MKRFSLKGFPYNLLLTVIFIVFAFWILAFKNAYLLKWLDEMSLFEPGFESLKQYLLYPGGIFRFAGTFLTQLLYYPSLGASVLILIWLLCAWLTKVSFNLSSCSTPLCFLVPLCLLASILHFDEACLTFESQGYVFYNTLGFTFSIAAYCIFRIFRKKLYASALIAILLPLLFPLAGFFALLPAILCIINLCIVKNNDRNKRIIGWVFSAITFVLVIFIPLLYYRYFNGTTADSFLLYSRGLPELTLKGYDWYLWSPFVFASVVLLLLTVLTAFIDSHKLNTSKAIKWISSALFIVGIICCLVADNKKSEQLHASVLMVNAIEKNDWSKVMNIMSLTKESPNYTMCVLDNLARAYSHKERRDLSNMVEQYIDPRHAEEYTITAFVNVPVNHYMGRFNQSHHWATEHIVQYGNKVFFIKYIVLNAIMNGDMKFAKKFNNLLMHTMFHHRWAEEMNKYIENPSLVKTMPDYDFLMGLRYEEMLRGE